MKKNWMWYGDMFLLIGVPILIIIPCMVIATLTKENRDLHMPGLFIGWVVALGWLLVGSLTLRKKLNNKIVKFYSDKYKLAVGWREDKYAVTLEDVEKHVAEMITKIEVKYANAAGTLHGCLLVFTSKPFKSQGKGAMVNGEQDGVNIIVGWLPDLSQTALQHELAHRVLELRAGDPNQEEAHRILASLGL